MKSIFTECFTRSRMASMAVCFFFLLFATRSFAQSQVTGTVSDDMGKALPGASVLVVGSAIGVVTDADGKYSISIPDGSSKLSFSFIGFETQIVDVSSRNVIDVAMVSDAQSLGEVVVTALGIERERRELGYSIQSIKPEDLTKANDFNIVNSLSGKIAGVQVTNSGSQIGASSRIVIRGNASFGNNQPLFVVDGIPIDNSTTNLDGGGGLDWGNTAADIDPQNIASLTVLKGASAAALYGSRASNGVILIETKKGNRQKSGLGVEFSSSAVFDVPSFFMNFQNEYGIGNRGSEYDWQQYVTNNPGSDLTYNEYAKQVAYNYVDGIGGGVNENATPWGPRFDAGLLIDQWVKGPNSPYTSNPDNIKDNYFQTGKNIVNQVAVTAKGADAFGRLAFSNRKMDGIFFNTDQTVNTINGSITLKPNNGKLTVGSNFNYVNRKSDNVPVVSYGSMTMLAWGAFRNIPLNEVKKVYEQHGNEMGSGYGINTDNYFYTLSNTNSMNRDRFYGNVNLNYELLDWLSVSSVIGMDYYDEYRKQITRSRTRGNINNNRGGQFSQTELMVKELNADARFNVNKQLTEHISLQGLVGGNFRKNEGRSMSLSASDLTVPDLFTISNFKGTPGTGMNESTKEMASIYSSASLGYSDFLFLVLTARNDWSSALPEANRSYFYPSASLSFLLTEALNIESEKISYLQLRTSVAKVGSDTDPYRLAKTYGIGVFNNVTLFNPSAVKPPSNLLPEETSSYEFGLELSMFDERVSVDATYYNQRTNNMILQVPVARSTGYASQLINAAEIENKGIEVIVNGRIVQGYEDGAFSWNASVNWARNRNKVLSLYGGLENITISSGFGGARSVGTPGRPWGDISGLPYVRNDEGKIVVGGNGLPMTTSQQVTLGNVTPDWVGGIQNTFSYRKVQLGALLDFRKGGDFFSTTMWHSYPTGAYMNTVEGNVRETGIIVDGVQEDGSPNTIRVSAQDYYNGPWVWNNHEYSIIDGSYIKLRELTLSYNFGKLGPIQNLNLGLFGRNLAILHRSALAKDLGLDPESASQMGGGERGIGFENFMPPTSRSYGFNLNVTF